MSKSINGTPVARQVDGGQNFVEVDEDSSGAAAISVVHKSIHDGIHYFMEGWTELNNTDEFYVKLVTPSDKEAHFSWTIEATGVLETDFYEGASGGMTGGTSVTPINSNRNSANTSGLTLTKGVSAPSSTGTTISSVKFGVAGRAWRMKGGEVGRDNEIILKKDTIYCRKFVSSSDNNYVHFLASWYEIAD